MVTLPFGGVGCLKWTWDGRGIAFLDATESNVWVQALDGGPSHQVTHFDDGRTITDFRLGVRASFHLHGQRVAGDVTLPAVPVAHADAVAFEFPVDGRAVFVVDVDIEMAMLGSPP